MLWTVDFGERICEFLLWFRLSAMKRESGQQKTDNFLQRRRPECILSVRSIDVEFTTPVQDEVDFCAAESVILINFFEQRLSALTDQRTLGPRIGLAFSDLLHLGRT